MRGSLVLLVITLILAGAAFYLWRLAQRQAQAEQVVERLGLAEEVWAPGRGWAFIELVLLRAGVDIPRERLQLVAYIWLVVLLSALMFGGLLAALLWLILPALLMRGYLSWRAQVRLKRMVEQLPGMLDQIQRSLQSGRTLGDATVRAIEASPEPLKTALDRVQRNVVLGVPLAEAMQEISDLYEQDELRILTLGMRVNHQYGGSANELLGSLIAMLHEREVIGRQLRAMTGETRLTAIVLGILPAGMGAYMMAMNPQYLLSMWNDASGQQMLIGAFILQAIGCFSLWRMLKSI